MSFNDGPGFGAVYGYGLYGSNVYGVIAGAPAPVVTGIYVIQDGYCPRYLRFQFSGIALPLYVFDINPSNYDAYPQRTTQQYQNILNFNPTVDENYNKIEIDMSWDRIPENMWEMLYPYTRKRVDGTSEPLFFWDGDVGRARESRVKVEYFKGEVSAGEDPIDRHNVSMRLRFL